MTHTEHGCIVATCNFSYGACLTSHCVLHVSVDTLSVCLCAESTSHGTQASYTWKSPLLLGVDYCHIYVHTVGLVTATVSGAAQNLAQEPRIVYAKAGLLFV